MKETGKTPATRASIGEKASRVLRNVHLLGALIQGAGAVAAPPLAAGAAAALAGAGGFEALRTRARSNQLQRDASHH